MVNEKTLVYSTMGVYVGASQPPHAIHSLDRRPASRTSLRARGSHTVHAAVAVPTRRHHRRRHPLLAENACVGVRCSLWGGRLVRPGLGVDDCFGYTPWRGLRAFAGRRRWRATRRRRARPTRRRARAGTGCGCGCWCSAAGLVCAPSSEVKRLTSMLTHRGEACACIAHVPYPFLHGGHVCQSSHNLTDDTERYARLPQAGLYLVQRLDHGHGRRCDGHVGGIHVLISSKPIVYGPKCILYRIESVLACVECIVGGAGHFAGCGSEVRVHTHPMVKEHVVFFHHGWVVCVPPLYHAAIRSPSSHPSHSRRA